MGRTYPGLVGRVWKEGSKQERPWEVVTHSGQAALLVTACCSCLCSDLVMQEQGCGVRLQVVMETIPEGGLSLSEHDALGRTLSKILNSDASCDYLELGGSLAVSECKRIF